MAQEWYVKVGQQARGPVGAAKLKQYATEGRLKPTMEVRCGSEGAWVPAAKIKGLFPAPPAIEEPDIFAELPVEPAAESSVAPPAPPAIEPPSVSIPAPQDDRSAHLPAFGDEVEEINPFSIVPPHSEPVIDEVPSIVVEPKPLVPAKAKAKAKPSRKSKPKRDEPDAEQESTTKGKAKGKRRGKRSSLTIQHMLGIAAALMIVGLSGALAYVLWPQTPGPTAPVAEATDTPTMPVSAAAVDLSLEELFDRTAAGVAFIEGRPSTGTGWIVAPNLLATNRHVIEGELMRHIKVHFPSAPEKRQGPYKAKVVYIDNVVDLAFLEVDTTTPPLERASDVEFRPGRDIAVIGCPGVSPDLTIKNGIVKGTLSSQVTIEGNSYDQLSISINPGNSGGPVFDLRGRVIGVVTLKARQQEGIGFAVPMAEVDRLFARAQAQSLSAVAEARALHRARVVVGYLEATGKLYKTAMETYLKVVQEAQKLGQPPESVDAPRDMIKSHIAALDEILMGDLEKEFAEIAKDESLSQANRDDILALGEAYREMKKLVDEPSKDLDIDAYAQRCEELGKEFSERTKGLAALKGK